MDFSPFWLAEREPVDVAARAAGIGELAAARLPADRSVRIIDLGSGTGSNARYLIPRLPREQDWLLVDGDPALLGLAPSIMEAWSEVNGYRFETTSNGWTVTDSSLRCRLGVRLADLNRLIGEPLGTVHLVTASALLDLVSEQWLAALASRCAAAGAVVLFALTYDGRMACAPEDPGDGEVRDLVNRHQRTDKGFGKALGPDAASATGRLFEAERYEVQRAPSDWVLLEDQQSVQRQLIEGWADAASELAPERRPSIDAWRGRRLLLVDAGRSRIVVGHEDLVAWPLR
jgi:hypothetical protein